MVPNLENILRNASCGPHGGCAGNACTPINLLSLFVGGPIVWPSSYPVGVLLFALWVIGAGVEWVPAVGRPGMLDVGGALVFSGGTLVSSGG